MVSQSVADNPVNKSLIILLFFCYSYTDGINTKKTTNL